MISEATLGPKTHFCPIQCVWNVLRACLSLSRPGWWSALTRAGGSSFSLGSASASGAQGRCRSRHPTQNILPLVLPLEHPKTGFNHYITSVYFSFFFTGFWIPINAFIHWLYRLKILDIDCISIQSNILCVCILHCVYVILIKKNPASAVLCYCKL